MRFSVVIPARYNSTRLPGKPLLDIGGKPMIRHVYERAGESGAGRIIIATDDSRVARAAEAFGAEVCLTSAEHGSGTERLAEVMARIGAADDEIVVNLQGDEPLMPAVLIHQVAQNLADHASASVATLAEPIRSAGELFDPHAVKVVIDREGYALYFSRAPIPWDRDAFCVTTERLPPNTVHYRHIGLYAYRAGFIRQYVSWPVTELERVESLEQLRVLWHGARIHVAEATVSSVGGVDTQADLVRVREALPKP